MTPAPKPKAAPASLLRPEQPFSQYTSYTCHNPLQEYTPDGPTQMMLARVRMSGPKPWYLPKDYGSSEYEPLEPTLPTIPSDVMAKEVDLSTFPTFDDWKEAMWAAPYVASHQVVVNVSYKPISHPIIGFEQPVNMMSDHTPPSGSHVYIPIPWIADYVKPPYEDFYLDGCRIPPYGTGLTGYEGLPLSYKSPM
eukprot:2416887-Amphidinium_carterae.1